MEQSTSVDIAATPAQVWAVLVDVERWPEWTASMRWVRRLDEGPLRTGSVAKISQPRLLTTDWVVTELEPVVGFTWVSTAPGLRTTAVHTLEPLASGGTRVLLSAEQGGPLGALVGRLYGGITERYLGLESAGLKRRCETGEEGLPGR